MRIELQRSIGAQPCKDPGSSPAPDTDQKMNACRLHEETAKDDPEYQQDMIGLIIGKRQTPIHSGLPFTGKSIIKYSDLGHNDIAHALTAQHRTKNNPAMR